MSVTIREHTLSRDLPVRTVFPYAGKTVATKRSNSKLTACILSPHPLVLSEFERLLAKSQFKVILKQLESTFAPDLRTLDPPKPNVNLADAHPVGPAPGSLW